VSHASRRYVRNRTVYGAFHMLKNRGGGVPYPKNQQTPNTGWLRVQRQTAEQMLQVFRIGTRV
jgi:hypothetical protein